MADKSDAEIEISDSQDKNKSDRDDPSPSLSDIVEVKIDVDESQSIGEKVKPDAASGDTASPTKTIVMESQDFVATLPLELTNMIFSYLSTNELKNCDSVSELWSRVTNSLLQSRYLIKHTRLKNNWINGKYTVHHLKVGDTIRRRQLNNVLLLPSNDVDFYYPLIMNEERSIDSYGLYVIHIDSNLRIQSELVFNTFFPTYSIRKVCVMGDCLVWIRDGIVEWYDSKKVPGSRVTNIDFLGRNYVVDGGILLMDSCHIVFMCGNGFLKVWCKQTDALVLQWQREESTLLSTQVSTPLCNLFNGCLIISSSQNVSYSSNPGIKSKVEIHNLRGEEGFPLQLTPFFVDGIVKNLNLNENHIFLNLESNYRIIQVRNKKSYTIKYSHNYSEPCEMYDVCDDFVLLKENSNDYRILILASGEWVKIASFGLQLYTLFENIALSCTSPDRMVQVLDWRKMMNLYNLPNPEKKRENIVTINKSRIVALDIDLQEFKIYKFD